MAALLAWRFVLLQRPELQTLFMTQLTLLCIGLAFATQPVSPKLSPMNLMLNDEQGEAHQLTVMSVLEL